MRALVCALATLAALAAAIPAAAAAQAANDEYDLALPNPNGDNEPAPTPPADTAPEAPAAPPVAPASAPPEAPASVSRTDESGTKPTREAEKLDQAAIRRDVLFERPETVATVTPEIASASSDDGGVPILLLALIAIGGACILATMVRLRKFTGGAAESVGRPAPQGAPGSQSS